MTSRDQPSERFRELQRIYSDVHAGGLSTSDELAGTKLFAGNSLLPFVDEIRALIERTGARTILDYGAGKGAIHNEQELVLGSGRRIGRLHDYWGVDRVALYDPGVPAYAQLPDGRFDGVISTDVLEHIPEEDIPWVLRELFDYAERFVFANIASYPAKKILPNGWNAHVTIRPAQWWRDRIEEASGGWGGQAYCFVVSEKREGLARFIARLGGGAKMKRTRIQNA
jgi:hypothetical protein